jgi:NH3-dependent NAD+ synthetase
MTDYQGARNVRTSFMKLTKRARHVVVAGLSGGIDVVA